MHIANVATQSIDGTLEPVDLGQRPAAIVVASFSDSDLSGIAGAYARRDAAGGAPSLCLAPLAKLRHPMSVDLWIDAVAVRARTLLVRVLGGYDYWAYGIDRLAHIARRHGIRFLALPGECCEADDRLTAASTVPEAVAASVLCAFRVGGPAAMDAVLDALITGEPAASPAPTPRTGAYRPGVGVVPLGALAASTSGLRTLPSQAVAAGEWARRAVAAPAGAAAPQLATAVPRAHAQVGAATGKARPTIVVLFYRAHLLADDVAPIDSLAAALEARGLAAVPLFVSSLKDSDALAFVAEAAAQLRPSAIVTATAFAAAQGEGAALFDTLGVPVFQAAVANTHRDAWADSDRGLTAADMAMHVVLPELDGRVLAGVLSFKSDGADALADKVQHRLSRHAPEPSRVAMVAERVAATIRLQQTPAAERRIVVVIPDYPAATGRKGYAVGLDVPASVLALLSDLGEAGYHVADVPPTPRALMDQLESRHSLQLAEAAAALPDAARAKIAAAWGAPPADARAALATFGNVTVTLLPDRGAAADRRETYHDPALPPAWPLVAFGHHVRHSIDAHALVHMGAHGTLEWLPGKAVALSDTCFPEAVVGALPVIYPFIVSNPGEAAQAKRRIAAVTLGHLPPPIVAGAVPDEAAALERLVDEYVEADGLDPARRDRLAGLILDEAARTGLDALAGVGAGDDGADRLKAIDAWLCDLKDFALKDGHHIYARVPDEMDPVRKTSAAAERSGLLAALAGRFVAPGPSGAPDRGRADVLPTGRNLTACDPRMMPTPTAAALGAKAAEEVIRYFCQEHGEWPRRLVIDLWGSASLRTAGEELAQGLALMGCTPDWDLGSGRLTGVRVTPAAHLGRPRVDVTFRVSGLFRDMFAAQVALLSAAVDAVSRAEEADNPLFAAREAGEDLARVFSSAPGTFGSGVEERLQSGRFDHADEIGADYLANVHALAADGATRPATAEFAERVRLADGLVHTGDDPGRDLLEGSADAAFIGGFAAANRALGGLADCVTLDTTDPDRPRARVLSRQIARVVMGRAVNPAYIAAQMRHGPRGAADLAETVDRLCAFAETTRAVPSALIDRVFDAYVTDPQVVDFLHREGPESAAAIAERFERAQRLGAWHPRRNDAAGALATLATRPATECLA